MTSTDSNRVTPEDGKRITFACCVEYGSLEDGTIRLVESLRRFGGVFADARVVAVTPRRGPALNPSTLTRFRELNVDYVRIAPENPYAWMPYLNKYFAVKEAEKRATGDLIAWLDSDILVLKPPTELLMSDQEDFLACPRDKNVGTSGPGDEYESYWQKLSADAGVDIDDLPWVQTAADDERIRLYWNAGMFVYRRDTGFADIWSNTIKELLEGTDSATQDKIFWIDQIALGLAAVKMKLRLRHLSGAANYGIATHFKDHLTDEGLHSATLLHYHDAMKPANWAWFMQTIAAPLPEAHAWLAQLGPSVPETDVRRDATQDAFKAVRQLRRRAWSRSHGAGLLGR